MNKKYNWILYLVLGVFILLIYNGTKNRSEYLNDEKNCYYVFGIIKSYEMTPSSGPSFNYTFEYDGVKIEDFHTPDYREVKNKKDKYDFFIGKSFLVKFNKLKPEKYNQLLLKHPLSDSLKKCCEYVVWDKLPFPALRSL